MIETFIECLRIRRHGRFFESERAFQGDFLADLRTTLPELGLPEDTIIEQEYQKRLGAHNITVRPDIIVHVPTFPRGDRRQNNFVVIELKLQASRGDALEDFASLDAVVQALDYPLAIFINIDSSSTHATHYRGPYRDRMHFFAVRSTEQGVELRHASYRDGTLHEELYDA